MFTVLQSVLPQFAKTHEHHLLYLDAGTESDQLLATIKMARTIEKAFRKVKGEEGSFFEFLAATNNYNIIIRRKPLSKSKSKSKSHRKTFDYVSPILAFSQFFFLVPYRIVPRICSHIHKKIIRKTEKKRKFFTKQVGIHGRLRYLTN